MQRGEARRGKLQPWLEGLLAWPLLAVPMGGVSSHAALSVTFICCLLKYMLVP